jgi:hypothetical protein
MEAQLILTKGAAWRGLLECISSATTSFPTPDSPVMSTEEST